MEYLVHCSGCQKPDKTLPDKKVTCDLCDGTGDYYDGDDLVGCEKCYCTGKMDNYCGPLKYHAWARTDTYGIYTGVYCQKCYNNPEIYGYRKDKYYDPAYCGEALEADY